MTATWDKNIVLTISLSAATAGAGSLRPFRVSDVALDGSARWAIFDDPAGVDDAFDAGEIDADTRDALSLALSQSPHASEVGVIRVDVTGGEGYDDALSAAEAGGLDFYGVALDTRAIAGITEASTWIEAREKILVCQSADSSWLDAGVPTGTPGFDDLVNNRRTAVLYHPTGTIAADFAWLSNRLAFNPETASPPWSTGLSSFAGYALTSTQRAAVEANKANAILPYGPASLYVDPGVMIDGTPIYEIVSRDWLARTIRAEIAAFVVAEHAAGRKIPVNEIGQGQIAGILTAIGIRGVAAQHFGPDPAGNFPNGFKIIPLPISTADLAARRLRFKCSFYLATAGRVFDFTINLVR